MIKYPSAGISITDSYNSAVQKASTYAAAHPETTKTGTESERTATTLSHYANVFVPGAKMSDGTPIIDSNGYITPLAWQSAINDALSNSISRADFIKQFGYLLYIDPKTGTVSSNYGLTPNEALLITK